MCGIAGILNTHNPLADLQKKISDMKDRMKHRGPDDEGVYISSDQKTALSHRRLAIIDLSPCGHQPMTESTERYWIVFNGEIYNFRQLREDLFKQGETFHSTSDTEVILKLYQKKGVDCVRQLRGMFAFAIWDNVEKTCFMARDPLGIKPLYYFQSNETLVFASELRAILASGAVSKKLCARAFYDYLMTGSVWEPFTLIDQVYCLEAGHWMMWKNGQLNKKAYWQIDFPSEQIDTADAVGKVRTSLIDSIDKHFVSDVPVGIFLSGGVDSTSIVALARQTQKGRLKTYSIAFEEEKWNEGDLAQKSAERFETEHTEFKITASFAKGLFAQFLKDIDQPSIDGFNTYCVSQAARQGGSKVVLSGLGGDEMFGGYASFQQIPKMFFLSRMLAPLRPLVYPFARGLETHGRSPRSRRLGDFLQNKATLLNAYRSFRGIFTHREANRIIQHYLPHEEVSRTEEGLLPNNFSLEDTISYLELSKYMRNQLLRDSDTMSMAHSLELRVPFVDRELFDAIRTIPASLRLAPGKSILVKAVPELPAWVTDHPKRGFTFPFQQWIEGDWDKYFPQTNVPKDISLSAWYRKFSLAVFNHWWETIQR